MNKFKDLQKIAHKMNERSFKFVKNAVAFHLIHHKRRGRMKKALQKILLALVLATLLAGCSSLKPFTAEDFRQMGYNIPTEQSTSK
jgi:hypothetical protein